MEYKREQTTTILRRRNSIRAFRVLDIRGNNLVVRNSLDRSKTAKFAVSEPDEYKVGDCVDMVFIRTGSNSYSMELIGRTPPEFTPKGNVEIW